MPSRSGIGKFLNSARFVLTELGPSMELRPVLPYAPTAGVANALRSNHSRILSPLGRSPQSTALRVTTGRWLGVPLRARSEPSTGLSGRPVRIETRPFNCHPFTAPRTTAFFKLVFGSSHSHENDPICFAWKSESPYWV